MSTNSSRSGSRISKQGSVQDLSESDQDALMDALLLTQRKASERSKQAKAKKESNEEDDEWKTATYHGSLTDLKNAVRTTGVVGQWTSGEVNTSKHAFGNEDTTLTWDDSSGRLMFSGDGGEALRLKLEAVTTMIHPRISLKRRLAEEHKEPWIPLDDDDFVRNDPEANLEEWDRPDRVIKGLYLGSMMAAQNRAVLQERNVTHVLTIGAGLEMPFESELKYMYIDILDHEGQNIYDHFESGVQFIHEARSSGGSVLVHCAAGISRSSSMTVAYLMKHKRMPFVSALKHVESRRWVRPNDGFVQQLRQYEEELGLHE